MRSFKKNNYGSTYFYMLIIIIVFICLMSVLEFSLFNEETNISGYETFQYVSSKSYNESSFSERSGFLNNTHGCGFTIRSYPFVGYFIDDEYVWSCDDFVMTETQYLEFCNGNADIKDYEISIDAVTFLKQVLLLDFSVFEYLDYIGIIIRVFIMVVIGIIVYLMLPFTG